MRHHQKEIVQTVQISKFPLRRSGRLEDVFIDDPFDPEGEVSVRLTEARWQSANRESPPRDAPPDRN
jgi:hypothetical protein